MKETKLPMLKAICLFMAVVCCSGIEGQVPDASVRARLQKHAVLFDYYSFDRHLENAKPDSHGIIDLSQHMLNDYVDLPGLQPAEALKSLAVGSALIVVGTTSKQESSLNTRHSFVFSDWSIKISRVFKNTSGTALGPGSTVIVVRPGGNLVLNGHEVRAEDESFPEFIMGHQYVMLLASLPDSGSFRGIPGAIFDITGTTPALLADPRDPTPLRRFASNSSGVLLKAIEKSVQ